MQVSILPREGWQMRPVAGRSRRRMGGRHMVQLRHLSNALLWLVGRRPRLALGMAHADSQCACTTVRLAALCKWSCKDAFRPASGRSY